MPVRRTHGRRQQRRRNRRGFTLIEIMIALTLLAFVVLGLSSATAPLMHTATITRVRSQANEVANSQVAQVLAWPEYSSLEATFAGAVNDWPHAGWRRTTTVVRVGGVGQTTDFKRITVTVQAPTLETPVARTITIAAP